ncbi:unnamed protein product, partial [Didymodactylos carnosus]
YDIADFDHKYLHQKIAMVSQEPLLLNRSIRENIIYALDNGSDVNDEANNDFLTTEIIDAAKFANAHTFITELVDGYETQCGQRGGHLNGSQTQRMRRHHR